MTRSACYLQNLGIVSALGRGKEATIARLIRGDTGGMVVESRWHATKPARVGRVGVALPDIPAALARYRCRTNALLLAAAEEIAADIRAAIDRYGAARVGVVIGTSTSGIAEGEAAIAALDGSGALPPAFDYAQQEMGTPATFLACALGVDGPAYVVSTACTSGAKALGCARNLLELGWCDAVIAGGVDSLCGLTINGFGALELTTPELCNPMSVNRRGINIGEGAALFVVSREAGPVALVGVGESSDAYHISAPDPAGAGAEAAMRAALHEANVEPARVDYVNLHGTATPQNDSMEAGAVDRVFGRNTACSSTKALTGHALGAAGAIEAGFCWLILSHYNAAQSIPPHVWDGARDPALPDIALVGRGASLTERRPRIAASNSFAFGGNNITLVLSENA